MRDSPPLPSARRSSRPTASVTRKGSAATLPAALETGSVYNRLYNPGFVLVKYFGFLRRYPDDEPDTDMNGHDFWLPKMDSSTLAGEDVRRERDAFKRIKRAQVFKAFIPADEHRPIWVLTVGFSSLSGMVSHKGMG